MPGRLVSVEKVDFAADKTAASQRSSCPPSCATASPAFAIEGETFGRRRPAARRSLAPAAGRADRRGRSDAAQPLLGDLYYVERALAPYAELRHGDTATLLQRDLAVLIMADVGLLPPKTRWRKLKTWIDKGGVLVRFAGPKLAQNATSLLPVRLRSGDRQLGGAMSWSQPAHLAPFPAESPFAGLAVPPEVLVEPPGAGGAGARSRQEDLGAAGRRHAAGDRGEAGQWLDRAGPHHRQCELVEPRPLRPLRRDAAAPGRLEPRRLWRRMPTAEPLPPLQMLDGYGRLVAPPPTALARQPGRSRHQCRRPAPSAGLLRQDHGAPRAQPGCGCAARWRPSARLPAGVLRDPFALADSFDLKPWLLGAALLLLLIDMIIALALRGTASGWRRPRRRRAAAAARLPAAAAAGNRAGAGDAMPDKFALDAAGTTRLAYVITGDDGERRSAKAGPLRPQPGARPAHRRRAGRPASASNLETDELTFFPLLYWRVPHDAASALGRGRASGSPTICAMAASSLRHRRPARASAAAASSGACARLLRDMDVPPLVPAPPDHVLTKAFYLLRDFPGRYAGGVHLGRAGRGPGQ